MTPANLTAARIALDLSQVELARVLGIHPTIVNRWERGRAKIPPYLELALQGIEKACLQADNKELIRSVEQWQAATARQIEVTGPLRDEIMRLRAALEKRSDRALTEAEQLELYGRLID